MSDKKMLKNNDDNDKVSINNDINLKKIYVWNKNPRFVDIHNTTFQNIKIINKTSDSDDIKNLLDYEFSHSQYQDNDDEDQESSNGFSYDAYKDFLYLCESLLKDGYKNDDDTIFVKKFADDDDKYFVLEGNRRISCIKILLNQKDYPWLDNNLNKKITLLIKKYSLDKLQKSLPNNLINVKVLGPNVTDNDIWHIIYARHNNKKIGKSRWLRIKFLNDVKFHFQKILKQYKVTQDNYSSKEKEILKNLSYILNKNSASYDLHASLWVTYALENTNIYSNEERKQGKIEISAFEKCFNFVRDPLTDVSRLSDYFKIDYNPCNWSVNVINNKKDYIECNDSKSIITFFLSEFKRGSYTTRGWKENKKYILKDFLFPSLTLDKKDTWLDLSANALAEELENTNSGILKDYSDEEKEQIKSYLKSLNDSVSYFKRMNNNLKLFKKKIDGVLSRIKPAERHNNYYCSLALLSSYFDSLLWEKPNDSILNLSTQKLPLAQLGLIIRESIIKILFILFVNPDSRNKLITSFHWMTGCTTMANATGGIESASPANNTQFDFTNESDLVDFAYTIDHNDYVKTIYWSFICNKRNDCLKDGAKIAIAFVEFLESIRQKFNVSIRTTNYTKILNCNFFKDFYNVGISSIPNPNEYFTKNTYSFVSSFVHWNYYDYKVFNIYNPSKVCNWMNQLKNLYSDLNSFIEILSNLVD